MADRAHRLGGDRGQVRLARARLIKIDLLQREDVGVELLDGVGQPVQLDAAVVNTASVQNVEGGHPHGYYLPTMTVSDYPARNDELRDALKRAASALKAQGPEFALAGSYAIWVHGGPEPVHDVDFVVDPEAGLPERLGRRVGIFLGDDEVDVVHGFRAAVHPQRVAARQGELGPLRLEGRRGALECVAQLIVSGGYIGIGHRGYVVPMRMATFNILHGRSVHDGSVELDRLADSIKQLDADILALQEVDLDQPRSGKADLTAVAAEAMGAVSHRFVAAISGTPGATWMAATGREQPGTAAYGIALLSRYLAESWQVVHLPRIPVRFPMYLPGPRRVQVVHEEPRAAMVARIDTPLGPLTVANTHLSFVPGWNRMQLRRLIRDLRGFPGPRVLMGDLNMTPPTPAAGRECGRSARRRRSRPTSPATNSTTSSPTTAHCGSTDARRRGCRSRIIVRLSSTFRGPEACG